MEVIEVPQQDCLQLVAEKRKWQTEIENKRRQLEDEKRVLQHLKSKALRERWLLDGPSGDGPEQDEIQKQLEEDEAKTRSLEKTISRLEQELVSLETGSVCQTITHTAVTSGFDAAVEVKGHGGPKLGGDKPSCQVIQEVRVHKSPQGNKSREVLGEMKKAMYSVEIKVERDKLTGETKVLSTNTTLPVDLSDQGIKVYEDEQKVVHEMNGEDGVHLLSSSEVDELLNKADEASMMSQHVSTVSTLPKAEVQEEPGPSVEPVMGSTQPSTLSPTPALHVATEITGLEAKAGDEPSASEASAENPVTMVFMGYQNVEDEDETKKVLGLQGTVKVELVLIDDVNGKADPPPLSSAVPPTSTKPPETVVNNEEMAVEVKKEKEPCKCCSIM